MTELALSPRRALATRNAAWAKRLAHVLRRMDATPNAVSIAGVGWSLVACSTFALAPAFTGIGAAIALVVAAAAIQLRLLCNLLDGMLAIEEGLKTRLGEIYNEVPDRVADVAILLGAGAAVRDTTAGLTLGCAAALAALFTAYVRVLGGSLGVTQSFTGPMAKPQRMFVLTLAALGAAVEAVAGLSPRAIPAGLAIIAVGAIVTACRRVGLIAKEMEAR